MVTADAGNLVQLPIDKPRSNHRMCGKFCVRTHENSIATTTVKPVFSTEGTNESDLG